MKSNLKSLKIIKNQSGSLRIALKYENQPNDYESYWIIGKDEVNYVINRLMGKEPTNYMINDGNYILAFGVDGILCIDLSNEKYIRHYVTFDGKLLALALSTANSCEYIDDYKRQDENVLIVAQDEINLFAYKARNISKIVYHDTDDFSVKSTIIRLCKDDKTKDYFRRQLKSFVRQVGELKGKLNILLDSWSEKDNKYPSFYFWLENNEGKLYYNGGIINHSHDDNIPDYSIHT